MSTFEIIQKYCEQRFEDETQRNSTYNALARPAILEEEARLQKNFFDFTEDELEHYILNLGYIEQYGGGASVSQSYVRWIVSYYRDLFRFYMLETGRYFRNPFDDKRFRSISGFVKEDMSHFTKGTLERMTLSLMEHLEPGEAEFTSLFPWLFYSGVFDIPEIINMKDSDVDLAAGTATLGNRTIRLKEECIELLKKNHKIDKYKVYRITSFMIPYHGSYVWFPFREETPPDGVDAYTYAYEQNQSRTEARIGYIISKRMSKVREVCHTYIKPDIIYYRGVYDYMVSRCGEDRTREILMADKSSRAESIRNSDELLTYLREYGAKNADQDKRLIYAVKGNLRAFLP